MNVAYIIPTMGNSNIINYHLRLLEDQVYTNFLVIVVNDSDTDFDLHDSSSNNFVYLQEGSRIDLIVENMGKNSGAAAARNRGMEIARERFSGDDFIMLLVGADCYPKSSLILEHVRAHKMQAGAVCVQGYSPFDPQIMNSEFMVFLDTSGMQANWGSLITDEGARKEATGFCLTTNYSLDGTLPYNFNEGFKGAAWEDVDFGQRLALNGVKTIFAPEAVSMHHHCHTVLSFLNRQYMEGGWRFRMCTLHPESAPNFINLEAIKRMGDLSIDELRAKSSDAIPEMIVDHKKMQYELWGVMMQSASMLGIRDKMNSTPLSKLALQFEHQTSLIHFFEIVNAIEIGNYGWAAHNVGWILDKENKWYSCLIASYVEKMFNNREASLAWASRSMQMNPTLQGRELLK